MIKTVLIALVIALCVAQQLNDDNKYTRPKVEGKHCRRDTRNNVNFSNGNKVLVITSRAVCTNQETKKRGAAAEIRFSMTSIGLARMRLEGRKRTSDTISGFRVGFAVDRLVEFEDPQGTGFAQGKKIVNEINFINRPGNTRMRDWSVISHITTAVGETTVHDITATGTHDDASIKIGVTFATAEVTVVTANQTVSKTVLRPNSFKLNLVVNNLMYKQSNTSIAIGAILVTKRGVKQRPTSRAVSQSEDGEDVADNTATQSVVDIEDEDASSAENAGFFSFKRFVFGKRNATSNIQQYTLVVTPIGKANETDIPDDTEGGFGGYVTRRLFVTPVGRPTQIIWDPAAGTNEDPITSGSSMNSLNILILAFVAMVFAMLY